MVAWKEVEPFLGLLVTTAVLLNARAFLRKERQSKPLDAVVRKVADDGLVRRKKVLLAATAGLVAGFLVLGVLIYMFKLPGMLEATHKDVVGAKIEARANCRAAFEQGNLVEAENWIRNDTVSRKLAHEFAKNQRVTLDRAIRPFANTVLFRSGALAAVLPLFPLLLASIALRAAGREWPAWFPSEGDWAFVLLPAMLSCLGITWIATSAFHFWLRERQFTSCMLISGHWYTASHTLFAFLLTLCFLRLECNAPRTEELLDTRRWTRPGSGAVGAYVTWTILYVALVSGALSTSQRFHHDAEESAAGVVSMLRTMVFSAGAGIVGLVSGLESAYIETPAPRADVTETDQDVLREEERLLAQQSGLHSGRIKRGQVCSIEQDFSAETDSELSAEKGALLHTIAEPTEEGWVEVEDTESRVGFVPAAFLVPSDKEFKLNLIVKRKDAYNRAVAGAEASDSAKSQPAAPVAAPEQPTSAEPKLQAPVRKVPAFFSEIAAGKARLQKPGAKPSTGPPPESAKPKTLFDEMKEKMAQNRSKIDPEDAEEWGTE